MRLFPYRTYTSGKRWCVFRWTHVDPEGTGEIYLTRFHIFQVPWCSCMLHWIYREDSQPDLHDHPNAFVSFVLKGWYVEELADKRAATGRLRRRVAFVNFKRALQGHRIVELGRRPTITLVFAGRVVRGWGFQTPHGWRSWREYVANRRSRTDSQR